MHVFSVRASIRTERLRCKYSSWEPRWGKMRLGAGLRLSSNAGLNLSHCHVSDALPTRTSASITHSDGRTNPHTSASSLYVPFSPRMFQNFFDGVFYHTLDTFPIDKRDQLPEILDARGGIPRLSYAPPANPLHHRLLTTRGVRGIRSEDSQAHIVTPF